MVRERAVTTVLHFKAPATRACRPVSCAIVEICYIFAGASQRNKNKPTAKSWPHENPPKQPKPLPPSPVPQEPSALPLCAVASWVWFGSRSLPASLAPAWPTTPLSLPSAFPTFCATSSARGRCPRPLSPSFPNTTPTKANRRPGGWQAMSSFSSRSL